MLVMLFGAAGFGCNPNQGPSADKALPEPANDTEPAAEATEAHAVFAGGCFWCTEAVFEQIEGVKDVVSGYAGGDAATASYYQVARGNTDHAEAIRITYDPSQVSYAKLLQIFFATHDPTQLNRQGPDRGPQYRSAVFYADPQQQQVAADYIRQLEQQGVYDQPIVTTLEPLEGFYEAEDDHQDFAARNPMHPYIQQWSNPKVDKARRKFPDQIERGP